MYLMIILTTVNDIYLCLKCRSSYDCCCWLITGVPVQALSCPVSFLIPDTLHFRFNLPLPHENRCSRMKSFSTGTLCSHVCVVYGSSYTATGSHHNILAVLVHHQRAYLQINTKRTPKAIYFFLFQMYSMWAFSTQWLLWYVWVFFLSWLEYNFTIC